VEVDGDAMVLDLRAFFGVLLLTVVVVVIPVAAAVVSDVAVA